MFWINWITAFASTFPTLNGFCWVNSFLFGRPTFPGSASPDHRGRAAALWQNLFPRPNPLSGHHIFYYPATFRAGIRHLNFLYLRGAGFRRPLLFSLWLPNPGIHL
jgi:hypothetical protein